MKLFRINELLKRKKSYSMGDLAKDVGMSRTNLYHYLNSNNKTLKVLQKISTELRVNVRDLFASENDENEIIGFLLMDDCIYYIKNEQTFTDFIDRFNANKTDKNHDN